LSGPYLYAGHCSDTGCTKGGLYKTCCEISGGAFTGNLGGNCQRGNYNGDCPAGSGTVMCGVDQATCNAVIAQGYNCTTGPCGQSACQAMVSSPPESTPAPGDPTSTPIPTPSNSFCKVGGQDAAVECCDAWIELNVPREATIGDEVYIDIYQHPAWSKNDCVYKDLGNTNFSPNGHLIAYGGEGSAGYYLDWDWICGFYRWSECGRDARAIYRIRDYSGGGPCIEGSGGTCVLAKSFPQTEFIASHNLDPVYTSDPIGHPWGQTRVKQVRIKWNTSGLPAGTYHFDNSGPYSNLGIDAHDNNCPSSTNPLGSACCQNLRVGFGGGYSTEGIMHQIFGGEVSDDGRIIGDIIRPNRMIRLNDPDACQNIAPSAPVLSQPPNDWQLRTDQVGLTWTHDGLWGENCAGNNNTFQVLVSEVGADSDIPEFSSLGNYRNNWRYFPNCWLRLPLLLGSSGQQWSLVGRF